MDFEAPDTIEVKGPLKWSVFVDKVNSYLILHGKEDVNIDYISIEGCLDKECEMEFDIDLRDGFLYIS